MASQPTPVTYPLWKQGFNKAFFLGKGLGDIWIEISGWHIVPRNSYMHVLLPGSCRNFLVENHVRFGRFWQLKPQKFHMEGENSGFPRRHLLFQGVGFQKSMLTSGV